MFFAIIGKNKQLSLAELELIKPNNLKEITNILFTFDTDFPELLNKLGGVIKRGELIENEDLAEELEGKKIIGTKDKDFGIKLKRQFGIKRFKLVDRIKTDIEVKKQGLEIVKFHNSIGVVRGYQNIKLYEKMDFEKPSRSMKMGMMPAKLNHIMLNIGIKLFLYDELEQKNYQQTNLQLNKVFTVWDPFSGSGTSGFLANYLGYNFVGSDIDIKHLEINKKWRQKQVESNNKKFEIFQQDITQDLVKNTINGNFLIVSEGRLGPMVTEKTTKNEITKYQEKVLELYKGFIKTISKIKEKHNLKAVFTIPYYIKQNNFLEQEIEEFSTKMGRKFTTINELYSREKQKVARKIIVLK
ncbi:MAG: hypothetical protein M0P94_01160 [Candidatus Absconditabacterales bacterium]|nr:hypothetical protein [Candidatus Absconditabacterales bacterium]